MEDGVDYVLRRDEPVLARSDLKIALHVFDAQLRGHIALHAPGRSSCTPGSSGIAARRS